MSGNNVLFLFSDEHRRDALGCYGHKLVQTPNLDALAASGTRFSNAYTPSPICVPARAAMATGEYVHRTRCWSNAQSYHGVPTGWGHSLQSANRVVESIGKLHYQGADSNNGFDQEHLPLYVRNGQGWIKGLLRDHESVLDCSHYAREIGPGSDPYTDYDVGVTERACDWLEARKRCPGNDPWTLFVSWLRPHYPLTCPAGFFDMYPLEEMDLPKYTREEDLPGHPVVRTIRRSFDYDRYFNDHTRQVARASYYGLCSFLDHQVGQVLGALEDIGARENTLVIYSSDHGDHNGDRRMWTKMSLFEESAGIPLILSGPDIPRGGVVGTPASLVDIHPTILQAAGLPVEGHSRPGIALQSLADRPGFDRAVLSEYHDGGSPTGMFMLRIDRWKYNYYPGYEPELYDLAADPGEVADLGTSIDHAHIRQHCHRLLETLVDPDQANRNAFDDQGALIEQLGGVEAIVNSDEFDFTPVR